MLGYNVTDTCINITNGETIIPQHVNTENQNLKIVSAKLDTASHQLTTQVHWSREHETLTMMVNECFATLAQH